MMFNESIKTENQLDIFPSYNYIVLIIYLLLSSFSSFFDNILLQRVMVMIVIALANLKIQMLRCAWFKY